jgi:GntR family transcriptional regulator/MocR family aminotransferase
MVWSPEPLRGKTTGPLFPPQLPVVELNPRSEQPLFEQVYLALRDQILRGRLRRGARLASTRTLARHLAVSRFTVVTALERLLAEGYLTARAGSGTYITCTLPEHVMRPASKRPPALQRGDHISPAMSSRGRALSTLQITGPRPGEPRAFQPRRTPLDAFPIPAWSTIVRRLWKRGDYRYLDYGDPAGYRPLREAIAAHIGVTRAVHCDLEQVIVTSGSQQAFDLLFRLLLDPGDCAWIEEPGYLDVRAALVAAGATLVPVRVDEAGIDVGEGMRLCSGARVAVVSPSHQYPAGVTLSATRRIELLNWARSAGAWIVEDDYDSYFRYAGRPMSSLQGVDRASGRHPRVLYVGTFSKTVFPSLRLGFCVVPERLVDAVANARAVADRNSPIIDQAVLTEFITDGHYDRHLRRLRMICQERYEAMRFHFARVLGDAVILSPASAGTHVLGRFREARAGGDGLASRVSALAADEGLVVFPLSRYCLKPPSSDSLVLGFGGLSPRRIAAGAEKLAVVIERARKHGRRNAMSPLS